MTFSSFHSLKLSVTILMFQFLTKLTTLQEKNEKDQYDNEKKESPIYALCCAFAVYDFTGDTVYEHCCFLWEYVPPLHKQNYQVLFNLPVIQLVFISTIISFRRALNNHTYKLVIECDSK